MKKRGFTLIELLIVIAILAVLATVVVLVLNPAQLFAQARDARRVEDLNSIRGAVNLYLTTVSSADLDGAGGAFTCGTNFGSSVAAASSTLAATTLAQAGVFTVTGLGWVPVDLTGVSGGSPLPTLPRDPVNTAANGYNYQYSCNNTAKTFELNANMESTRYASSGTDDVESTDGGNNVGIYEVGNEPGLDI